jgi:long-chain acyl-CoA synthetase
VMTTTQAEPAADASGQRETTTIVTRVRDRAGATPDTVALREKDFGIWQEVTWGELWDWIERVAHGLLALGVQPGDRVAIHSENRCEWLYGDHAIVGVRAMTVGLYPTNPADEVRHMLADSGTKVLIAEDQEQVDKALAVIDQLPDLERIVYIEPRGIRDRYEHPKLLYWNEFLALGEEHRQQHPEALAERMAAATPDDVMTLIYTSGTTGPPKGAMLSVRNVEFAIETLIVRGGFVHPPPSERDTIVSYLPLCHAAERIFTVWNNAVAGVQVNFAESIDTIQQDLAEVQPTILFGVPRIWEKILASIEIRTGSASALKRLNYRVWMAVARRIGDQLRRSGGHWSPGLRLLYALSWLFLLRSLRKRIGVSKARHAVTGAAPIAPEVMVFFLGLGVPMHEVYGMTENTAVATATCHAPLRVGTVGQPHPGIELRIDDTTGEILTRHPGNFVGYWGLPDKTAEVLDPDGWLHTGDVGEWVDGQYVRIVDRMKDIIITSGGKNISPSEIENSLKASPYVKEAVVIGDGRKFLTALIGIELDTVGDWAQRRRIPYTTYRDLAERDETRKLVRDIVRATNEKFARVEQVKAFRMLPKELDHEDGELTATQKVKRAAMVRMFEPYVEAMYGGPDIGAGMTV